MRKTKTFKIEGNDKSFEVRELKVKEILALFDSGSKKAEETTELIGLKDLFVDEFLPLVSNVTIEDIKEMTPGELEIVYGHFEDVNKAFFAVARKTGFQDVMQNMKQAFISDFSNLLASLSKMGTRTP